VCGFFARCDKKQAFETFVSGFAFHLMGYYFFPSFEITKETTNNRISFLKNHINGGISA
jgi:hypothetical protein